MANNDETFAVRDIVVWDREIYPTLLPDMLNRYGEGPFRVVGVRLHPDDLVKKTKEHPEGVTIELPDGSRQEMSAGWFKKTGERR